MAWVQGWYVKQAIQSSVMICGLADKKAVSNMPKYPDMPKTDDEVENETSIKAKQELLIAKMKRWAKLNNKKK